MNQTRRFPRYKIPPKSKIKARLRIMGEKVTHYLEVGNLSIGGAGLYSKKKIPIHFNPGDVLEVLLVGGHLSLKCVARLVQVDWVESDKPPLQKKGLRIGIEIIGIDERGRKILGDFLENLSKNHVPTDQETASSRV